MLNLSQGSHPVPSVPCEEKTEQQSLLATSNFRHHVTCSDLSQRAQLVYGSHPSRLTPLTTCFFRRKTIKWTSCF